MKAKSILLLLLMMAYFQPLFCQEVAIQSYSIDNNGQVLLEVNSTPEHYYILQIRHHPDSSFTHFTSMTYGQPVSTTITEPLQAYPSSHYRVLEYPISEPFDIDADGENDISEDESMPHAAPLNDAATVPEEQGLVALRTPEDFEIVATNENNTPWVEYLTDVLYTKFIILDFFTDSAQLYFINCNTNPLHSGFANYLGIDQTAPSIKKGQIIYNPNALASNGTLGTYAFNFSSTQIESFSVAQRAQEMIAANMPFLTNNLSYFLTTNDEEVYYENIELYQSSRVPVLFESDAFAGVNYWGLNQSEGFGYFRLMAPGEVPNPKDIVLYESIPNVLPHVGGIITSVFQTPLSHVNLRAIQDNIPNAYIRNPLDIDSVAALLGHYIYFKTKQSNYEIREASLEEVNAWYESERPSSQQIPLVNLSYTRILSLDNIEFPMFDGFGAKTTNVATMRTFGFAPGTIPDGFGIPFYYYHEFMEYNGLFDEVEEMLSDTLFLLDRDLRDLKLDQLRDHINSATMPLWMLDSLTVLQNAFTPGISIRCRSSTNNEDLPEFSGAGLYDSKTHHPDEGHISKTIKQVFASLWNLRAFDEREFFRVNHFSSCMGVLCHPNFEDELVNGVGISADPIYETENTYYLNSQLGEELITNPGTTQPEELLVQLSDDGTNVYSIIQYSSLIEEDTLLMSNAQMDLLSAYLTIIHDRFGILYGAQNNNTFAMDIEFKITSDHQLVIKQARPWVTYQPATTPIPDINDCGTTLYPNPAQDHIHVGCKECGVSTLKITDLTGKIIHEQTVDFKSISIAEISISHLPAGIYLLSGLSDNKNCNTLIWHKW
jgi:hypothetical protein